MSSGCKLCRLLLFPPTPAPKSAGNSSERLTSETIASRPGAGNSTGGDAGNITYTWENTCVFKISKDSKLAVEPDHPWPLICSAAFCCAMVTRCVLRTSNYSLLVRHFLAHSPLHPRKYFWDAMMHVKLTLCAAFQHVGIAAPRCNMCGYIHCGGSGYLCCGSRYKEQFLRTTF
jgi:hypothetical protein